VSVNWRLEVFSMFGEAGQNPLNRPANYAKMGQLLVVDARSTVK
jgi:hypothetical protein